VLLPAPLTSDASTPCQLEGTETQQLWHKTHAKCIWDFYSSRLYVNSCFSAYYLCALMITQALLGFFNDRKEIDLFSCPRGILGNELSVKSSFLLFTSYYRLVLCNLNKILLSSFIWLIWSDSDDRIWTTTGLGPTRMPGTRTARDNC
jgi:hypothetical protein